MRAMLPDFAAVERVHSMPGQGVASTFTFGLGYGRVLGALEALGVPTVLVEPRAWKLAVLGKQTGTGDKLADRARGKALAIARVKAQWPGLSLKASERCRIDHDGMADALCIALWASEVYAWLN